jgi:hypothetical protein
VLTALANFFVSGVLFPGWEILDLMGPLALLQKLGNATSRFNSVKIELVGASSLVENTAALPFYTDRLFSSDHNTEGENEWRLFLVEWAR